jgi:predicted O-methyltransferase YrrM
VRQGGAVAQRPIDDRGDAWLEAFIAAMHARATGQAPKVAAAVGLSGVSRVLDVGGGSGVFAMAFARAQEGLEATVFDLPNVVPLTRGYVKEAGLGNRVDVVTGDYLRDDLGSGFDLVFLSAIVHSNSERENALLIGKCAKALSPGGRVVVQDFIMEEDRTRPSSGAMFALNMLVATATGDTFTEGEVRGWMEEAGLGEVRRKDTEFGTTLMTGRKPRADGPSQSH